jgi:hypothetical protein
MASLSAQSIVSSRPWRMTRIQTRISHIHPTASIHRRGTLLRLGYSEVLRAGPPPAMLWRIRVLVTRSEATVERWMGAAQTTRSSRRSWPAEDRAQAGGGPEQEDRGRIRADDVYPECWRSIHLSDDGGDTPRASGHCMCDLHMHMYRSTALKWY